MCRGQILQDIHAHISVVMGPHGSYHDLVWSLEVERLFLIIQVTQNVIIRVVLGGSTALEGRGPHFPGPALVPVK